MATAYWFKHDNNARSSLKIKSAGKDIASLENCSVSTGIAIAYADFFRILEVMDSETSFINLNNKYALENLSDELSVEPETLNKRLSVYLDNDLFEKAFFEETNQIGSSGFSARKLEALKRSKGQAEITKKRWEELNENIKEM